MAKINMQELLEDRENGTAGPWVEDTRAGYVLGAITGDGWYPVLAQEVSPTNSRRIARLPDLEEAYIEAVEALKKIAAEASVSVDENCPGSWRGVAVERIDIARDFLERDV